MSPVTCWTRPVRGPGGRCGYASCTRPMAPAPRLAVDLRPRRRCVGRVGRRCIPRRLRRRGLLVACAEARQQGDSHQCHQAFLVHDSSPEAIADSALRGPGSALRAGGASSRPAAIPMRLRTCGHWLAATYPREGRPQAEDADDSQVDCDHVVQQAGHQQDQDPSDQRLDHHGRYCHFGVTSARRTAPPRPKRAERLCTNDE